MKKIMEMLQNMKAKNEKKDNKGFSLVELIIVIAIMAILVGVVGTQVLPYINKSKEAKDFQIISSYGTAAMTAYSSNADKIKLGATETKVELDVYPATAYGADTNQGILSSAIQDLTYDAIQKTKFKSTEGQKIKQIHVTYDFSKKVITTQAMDGTNKILDPVESDM